MLDFYSSTFYKFMRYNDDKNRYWRTPASGHFSCADKACWQNEKNLAETYINRVPGVFERKTNTCLLGWWSCDEDEAEEAMLYVTQ